MSADTIDAEYEVFLSSLDAETREVGRRLAHSLGLAPTGVPWSEVFGNAVTLAAPRLVVTSSSVDDGAVRLAVRAHMLAVIEAFASDRLLDGQVSDASGIPELLVSMRRERDAALERVGRGAPGELGDFHVAGERTREAILRERALFEERAAVSFEEYLRVSADKQRLGLPAGLALAVAAGWDQRRQRAVADLLMNIWLGLQLHDDVVDWPDDLKRGGAWALCLALTGRGDDGASSDDRALVLSSGVLVRMLRRARRYYGAARRRARALGAVELSEWAAQRESRAHADEAKELSAAGGAARAHQLAAWAKMVL